MVFTDMPIICCFVFNEMKKGVYLKRTILNIFVKSIGKNNFSTPMPIAEIIGIQISPYA